MLANNLEIMTSSTLSALPRTDHIVNSTSYNQTLVRKHILENPARKVLPDKIRDLAMQKEVFEAFVDDVFSVGAAVALPEVVGCDAALSVANATMSIIAGCNALEDFAGTSRGREMAEHLLAKASGLPEALRKRLQKASEA